MNPTRLPSVRNRNIELSDRTSRIIRIKRHAGLARRPDNKTRSVAIAISVCHFRSPNIARVMSANYNARALLQCGFELKSFSL